VAAARIVSLDLPRRFAYDAARAAFEGVVGRDFDLSGLGERAAPGRTQRGHRHEIGGRLAARNHADMAATAVREIAALIEFLFDADFSGLADWLLIRFSAKRARA